MVKREKLRKHTFIDLFAGCGGLILGLEQAGAEPCFMNEVVPTYVGTYIHNHDVSSQVVLENHSMLLAECNILKRCERFLCQ